MGFVLLDERDETDGSWQEAMDGGCRIIMDRRIAILGIIVEDMDRVERVNELLHEYREYIVGRMGMPYRERGVSVISVVMDADTNTVSALSGKLGMTQGVSAKAVYSKT